MRVSFTKMHGAGNDFVVFDGVNQCVNLTLIQIRPARGNRRFGVGCDQVLLVRRRRAGADFRYRIFNADGGEGRAVRQRRQRCFVRFVRDRGLTQKDERSWSETLGGLNPPRGWNRTARCRWTWACRASSHARCRSRRLPRAPLYDLEVGGQTVQVTCCPWAIRTRCNWCRTWMRRR